MFRGIFKTTFEETETRKFVHKLISTLEWCVKLITFEGVIDRLHPIITHTFNHKCEKANTCKNTNDITHVI